MPSSDSIHDNLRRALSIRAGQRKSKLAHVDGNPHAIGCCRSELQHRSHSVRLSVRFRTALVLTLSARRPFDEMQVAEAERNGKGLSERTRMAVGAVAPVPLLSGQFRLSRFCVSFCAGAADVKGGAFSMVIFPDFRTSGISRTRSIDRRPLL